MKNILFETVKFKLIFAHFLRIQTGTLYKYYYYYCVLHTTWAVRALTACLVLGVPTASSSSFCCRDPLLLSCFEHAIHVSILGILNSHPKNQIRNTLFVKLENDLVSFQRCLKKCRIEFQPWILYQNLQKHQD